MYEPELDPQCIQLPPPGIDEDIRSSGKVSNVLECESVFGSGSRQKK